MEAEEKMKRFIIMAIFLVILTSLVTPAVIYSQGIKPQYNFDGNSIERHELSHDGQTRTYWAYVPSSYTSGIKTPLVLVLHGGGGNAKLAAYMTGFANLAEEEGFICVFPNGTGMFKDKLLTWNADSCCGYAAENDIDDVGFIDTVLDELCEGYSIDETRIYATGMSNGAMMSYRLGCELSHRFAAIAPVAGALNCECAPSAPLSVVKLHGTDDEYVRYEGGVPIVQTDKVPRVDRSVAYSVDFWTRNNGCMATPTERIDEDSYKIETYSGGRLGTEVKFYTLRGFGHAWPGGNKGREDADDPTCEVDATSVIWEFFKAHPKQENRLKGVKTWAYQIDNLDDKSVNALSESSYDMLVVDRVGSMKEEESRDDKAFVDKLRESDEKIVLCYLDVGQAESYRTYWQDGWGIGNPEWILGADPDGWDDNYTVKFWDREWIDIMKAQLDAIVDAGFDGAYFDWLEVYDAKSVKNTATAEEIDAEQALIDFVRELTSYARAKNPDFLLVAQNASEMGKQRDYLNLFDAIAQEAIWFDGSGDPDTSDTAADIPVNPETTDELIASLRMWSDAGLPVFNCEYAVEMSDKAYAYGRQNDFITYCTTCPLDRLSDTPPDFFPPDNDTENPDNKTDYVEYKDIPYLVESGITNEKQQSLDVYAPEDASDAHVMVYVHGGGWSAGDKSVVHDKATYFTSKGYIFISVNYRLIPDGFHPNNATDVAAALSWVYDNISEYGGDPNWINLMGHSAGAHLVSLVATDENLLAKFGKKLWIIRSVTELDTNALNVPRMMEAIDSSIYKDAFGDDPDIWKDASPYHHIEPDKGIPPFLLIHANEREAKEQSAIEFGKQLYLSNIYSLRVAAPDRTHGTLNQFIGKEGDQYTEVIFNFIESLYQERILEFSIDATEPKGLLTVDGEKAWVKLNCVPEIQEGRTCVGIRDISDVVFDGDITWDGETKVITIISSIPDGETGVLELMVGEIMCKFTKARPNGEYETVERKLLYAPYIGSREKKSKEYNYNRTLAALRDCVEIFGGYVYYNSQTRYVTFKFDKYLSKQPVWKE